MLTTGNNIQRLSRWLPLVTLGASASPNGFRLGVYHAGIDEEPRLLQDLEIAEPPSHEALREIIDKIDQEAREDAESLGLSPQRYIVRARDRQTGKEVGSISLRYSGNPLAAEGSGFADSTPPNSRGLLALAMQQTENAYRTLISGFGMTFENMNRQNQRNDAVMDKTSQAMARTYQLMEDLSDKRFEREVLAATKKQESDLALRKEEAGIEHDRVLLQAGIDHVAPLLPILANRFVRKGGDQTAVTPRDELMASLFRSMTKEQEQALSSVLTETQFATLVEISESISKVRGGDKKPPVPPATTQQAAPTAAKRTPTPTTTPTPTPVSDQIKARQAQIVEAIDYLGQTLLPWAVLQLQKGETLDPRLHSENAGEKFRFMMQNLAEKEYTALLAADSPLGEPERIVFAKMAEAMNMVPAPDPSKGAAPAPDGRDANGTTNSGSQAPKV
jgi:hypothetical protein